MINDLIIQALHKIGYPTEREIFDYVSMFKNIQRYVIKNFLEAKNINYYFCEEYFAKKRYTLNFIINKYLIPKIHTWPTDLNLLKNGLKSLELQKPISIKIKNTFYNFFPDFDRYVVFCITSNHNLDGVIDFRNRKVIKIRFPTIIYNTINRTGKSEWMRACELFSNSNGLKYLRLRGAGL